MRRLTSSFLLMGSLALAISGFAPALSPMPIAADSAGNHVAAQFRTAWIYDSSEDTFSNAQVAGRKWWQASIQNGPDETGAPLSAVALRLESALAFDNLQRENLVTLGPPIYEWSFGDVSEGSDAGAWVDSLHDSNPVPVTFSPGFDAFRSADKTEFTEPDTQTLTITLTPRETAEGFSVLVQAEENDMVSPVITSPASGEGVSLRQEGHSLHIDPTGLQLNTTWTVTITIEVTPKASKVVFMPYVMIGWEGEATASGAEMGSALSRPLGHPSDEAGTWTWSAEGTYEWHWEERLSRDVSWPHTSKRAEDTREPPPGSMPIAEPGNHVSVCFVEEFLYDVSGDTFVNREVTGKRRWRALEPGNLADETGAPVVGVKLTLESDLDFGVHFGFLRFGGVSEDRLTKRGPPTYEWSLGDVAEETQLEDWGWDALVGPDKSPTGFAPGLDVSRSFDKTSFSAEGTQTLTITVTPREEWVEGLSIFLHTTESALVDPVIVSISPSGGGRIERTPDGHRSGVHYSAVELNTPLTTIYTIQVTPKVLPVVYKPYTAIDTQRRGILTSGVASGSLVSYTNEAGTWTFSAEGDYHWHWASPSAYSVVFGEATGPAMSWQVIIGIVAGVIIASPVIYFFVRRRLRKKG